MENNYKKAKRATIIGIVANILLSLLKGIVGVVANSKALIADAVHSASDVISSITILIGLHVAQKPADSEHPYGHGKAEYIAALFVSFLLVLVGFEIAIKSITVISSNNSSETSSIALVVILFSILVKEGLYQYKVRLGKKLNSPALIADAWHHRSDSLTSFIALVGVGFSIYGSRIGASWLSLFDPIAGVIIALFVIWMGFSIGKDAVMVSLEKVLDKQDIECFEEKVLQVTGVKQIDLLNARTHGSYVIIDIKVSVDPTLTVVEGHKISKRVKQKLKSNFIQVKDVFVHINPYNEEQKNTSNG